MDWLHVLVDDGGCLRDGVVTPDDQRDWEIEHVGPDSFELYLPDGAYLLRWTTPAGARLLRVANGWSTRDLARLIVRANHSTVLRWESGRRPDAMRELLWYSAVAYSTWFPQPCWVERMRDEWPDISPVTRALAIYEQQYEGDKAASPWPDHDTFFDLRRHIIPEFQLQGFAVP